MDLHGCPCLLYDIVNAKRNPDRVEKYRPDVLEDVVGNVETIERLKVIAEDGNMPHIIISVSLISSKIDMVPDPDRIVLIHVTGNARYREDYVYTLPCSCASR
jgi:hypothetical protein